MIKFNRLLATRKQLGWIQFIKFFLSKLSIKAFDPFVISSYSQFGEDRVIEIFFGAQAKGFFVDVGCNHPVSYSNTWKLYLRGWSGICIDPNPKLISQYKKSRPRDIAIQAVISNNEDLVDFYFSKDSHLISGIGPKLSGHWKRTAENSNIIQCRAQSLTKILEVYNAPNQFDLLSIDVEGEELAVLQSMDFKKYKPRFIVIEIHQLNLSKPDSDPVYLKLASEGYSIFSYLRPTGFFSLEQCNG